MASVYKAVKEREDCDVDVVIQPIFRATKLADEFDIKANCVVTD